MICISDQDLRKYLSLYKCCLGIFCLSKCLQICASLGKNFVGKLTLFYVWKSLISICHWCLSRGKFTNLRVVTNDVVVIVALGMQRVGIDTSEKILVTALNVPLF